MTQTLDTSVLVVGAGPTGLVLVSGLSGYGINCVLVERNTHTTRFPKMGVTNDASPRMIRNVVRAPHDDSEINLSRMVGMLTGMSQ